MFLLVETAARRARARRVARRAARRGGGAFAVLAVLGVGLAGYQVVPFLELMASSARGSVPLDAYRNASMPVTGLLQAILPDAYGHPIEMDYWFPDTAQLVDGIAPRDARLGAQLQRPELLHRHRAAGARGRRRPARTAGRRDVLLFAGAALFAARRGRRHAAARRRLRARPGIPPLAARPHHLRLHDGAVGPRRRTATRRSAPELPWRSRRGASTSLVVLGLALLILHLAARAAPRERRRARRPRRVARARAHAVGRSSRDPRSGARRHGGAAARDRPARPARARAPLAARCGARQLARAAAGAEPAVRLALQPDAAPRR